MRIYVWTILFGCVLLAPAAWGQGNPGNGTVTDTSTLAEIDTYNTTSVTQQVNTRQVELKARMQGGAYLFDQTYNVAFTDPSIAAAITQAKNLLTNAGALSFTGPTQLSSSQSLVSSVINTVQTGSQLTNALVYTTTYLGPQTIFIGSHGICQSYNALDLVPSQLTGCSLPGTSFVIAAGGEDLDTFEVRLVTISQTVTTTNTTLTSQVYEIDGFTSSFGPCDVNQDGKTNVHAQDMVNEALGVTSPANDLNGDGVANVVDLLIVMNAALNLGCSASTDKPATVPAITAVVNAANFHSGPISPGEVVALLGTGLGSNGVQVLFDGTPAHLTYIGATQINCVVPYEVSGKGNPVVQVRHQGGSSIPFPLTTIAATPALFTAEGSGAGPAAALNQDGSFNSPTNPAARGSTVVLFMTGEGQTSPPGVTGRVTALSGRTPQPLLPVAVLIGDQPASVTFYGEVPGVISGVMQLHVQIPSNVPPGDLPVSVSVGGNAVRVNELETLFLSI
jgi:uncharacterized protein (TIGR03437 family)